TRGAITAILVSSSARIIGDTLTWFESFGPEPGAVKYRDGGPSEWCDPLAWLPHPRYNMDMRILVTGDRFWFDPKLAAAIIRRLVDRFGSDIVIVHGGATGVDESFAMAAKGLGVSAEAHPVTDQEWQRLGKRAGPIRNGEMVRAGAGLCLAVHH